MQKNLLQYSEVIEYLSDAGVLYDMLEQLGKKYDIPEGRIDELVDVRNALVSEEIAHQDVAPLIQTAFGLSEDIAKRLTVDFLGHVFLPLEQYLPWVSVAIKELGGDISQYPAFRIVSEALSAEDVITDFTKEHAIELPPELKSRFTLILKPYILKQKAVDATIVMLTRETGIGGMAISEDIARNMLKALDEYLNSGVRVEELDGVEEVQGTKGAEDAEIPAEVSEPMKEEPEARPEPVTEPAIEPAVEPVVAEVVAKPAAEPVTEPATEPVQKTKANDATPSSIEDDESLGYVFDVAQRAQDLQETKEILPVPEQKVLAESSAKPRTALAVATTHALATSVPVVNGDFMTEDERGEVDAHVKTAERVTAQAEAHEVTISEEANAVVDAWWPQVKSGNLTKIAFGRLVDTVLRGVRTISQFEATVRDKYRFTHEQVEGVSNAIVAVIVDRNRVIFQKQQETLKKEAEAERKEEEKKQSASIVKNPPPLPAQAKAEISTPTVHPKIHGQQKVTDVMYVKKTVGPVDELGTMTVAEFRLLAARPQDLADAVIEKMNAIGQDGYEERLQAIHAWKKSPVNTMYVRLLGEAMKSQKALPEVITEARAKGVEVLSPAEVDAIMAINRQLKV